LKNLLASVKAVSSDTFPKQIKDGMQAGYCAYLTKPYKIAALMDTIDSELSRK
jgi:response regulator of citrate/malate metabolism